MRTKAPFKTTHEQNDSRRLDGALVPLVSGPVRLLNEPFKRIIHVPSLFQNHKSLVILAAVVAVWISLSSVGSAQEVADTIRVNTRVVFMDALVKDKRTGVPISDLKPRTSRSWTTAMHDLLLISLAKARPASHWRWFLSSICEKAAPADI